MLYTKAKARQLLCDCSLITAPRSIRGSEEYQQPDGDEHWPVTLTSKKRISEVPHFRDKRRSLKEENVTKSHKKTQT